MVKSLISKKKEKPMEKIKLYAGTSENVEILVEKLAVKIFNCRQSAGKAGVNSRILRDYTLE